MMAFPHERCIFCMMMSVWFWTPPPPPPPPVSVTFCNRAPSLIAGWKFGVLGEECKLIAENNITTYKYGYEWIENIIRNLQLSWINPKTYELSEEAAFLYCYGACMIREVNVGVNWIFEWDCALWLVSRVMNIKKRRREREEGYPIRSVVWLK